MFTAQKAEIEIVQQYEYDVPAFFQIGCKQTHTHSNTQQHALRLFDTLIFIQELAANRSGGSDSTLAPIMEELNSLKARNFTIWRPF